MSIKRIMTIFCCLMLCLTPFAAAEGAADPVYEPEFQTVTLDTGITMRYALLGAPDGAPIVLIHGATDSYLSYSQLAPVLAQSGYAVYVPELRGHGGTDKPEEGPYTLSDHIADLNAWATSLNLNGFMMVGHSLGSFVVQGFTAEYGEAYAIPEIVLIGSAASTVGNPTLDWMLHGDEEFPGVGVFAEGVPEEFIAEWVETSNADERFKELTYENAKNLPPYAWINTFFGLENADNTELLATITCPVRIVWGTEDVFFGEEDQQALMNALSASADVKLYTIENASHNTHWDDGKLFAVAEAVTGK